MPMDTTIYLMFMIGMAMGIIYESSRRRHAEFMLKVAERRMSDLEKLFEMIDSAPLSPPIHRWDDDPGYEELKA